MLPLVFGASSTRYLRPSIGSLKVCWRRISPRTQSSAVRHRGHADATPQESTSALSSYAEWYAAKSYFDSCSCLLDKYRRPISYPNAKRQLRLPLFGGLTAPGGPGCRENTPGAENVGRNLGGSAGWHAAAIAVVGGPVVFGGAVQCGHGGISLCTYNEAPGDSVDRLC